MSTTIYNINNAQFLPKMAGFDYDHTLVEPLNGKTFPTDVNDWQWLTPAVPIRLKEYHDNGCMIVVFTNQSKEWKHKQIKLVMEQLNIPLFIVIATKKEEYKPNIGLFTTFIGENAIIKKESFFVGDAGGRPVIDFSDCDKAFAKNIGIKWYSPEEIFIDKSETFVLPVIPLSNKEIIFTTGYPGSGKSTICKDICKDPNYIRVPRDTHKTVSKMKKVATEHIKDGKSIVFDATHSSIKARKELVDFAVKHNYTIKCIWVTTNRSISNKRNKMRPRSEHVPPVAYGIYNKHFDEPTEQEGFVLVKV